MPHKTLNYTSTCLFSCTTKVITEALKLDTEFAPLERCNPSPLNKGKTKVKTECDCCPHHTCSAPSKQAITRAWSGTVHKWINTPLFNSTYSLPTSAWPGIAHKRNITSVLFPLPLQLLGREASFYIAYQQKARVPIYHHHIMNASQLLIPQRGTASSPQLQHMI
jgi:hypothetical protein